MREGWVNARLGDVCLKIQDGAHHSPRKLYSEGGPGRYRYITSKNIRNGHMEWNDAPYVDTDFHNSIYPRCNPEAGDILLTKDGANTGNVSINSLGEPFSLLSSVCLIKTNPNLLIPKFLFYYIQSRAGFEQITGNMTGAAIKRIILKTIKKSIVPLPSVAEQQRIVAILDETFAALSIATANANKNLKNARELLQSTIHSAVSQGGAKSDNWPSVELRSLVTEGRGISYGVLKPGRHDPLGVRVIKSQQVRNGWIDLTQDFRISKELDEEYSRTRLQGGEVLLNVVGSIGRSVVAPNEIRGANVTRAIAVIPVHRELSAWVQYNIHAHAAQQLLKASTGGVAQPVLNLSDVKALPIPAPPPLVRDKIVKELDEARAAASRLEALYECKIAALANLRRAIFQRAFTGELTSHPSSALKEAAE